MKDKIAHLLTKQIDLKKEEIINLIEIPPSQELGDYAFPCFSLSKKLKENPSKIASNIAKKISPEKEFEKILAKGSYVNFFLNKKLLVEKTLSKILKEKEKYGSSKSSSKKVMIEFSQPNTHKAFHVGHIRGTSLGESISHILEFSGNKVIRANYSGDTGMHIAKWLWCYLNYHKKEKLTKDESWIARIYVDAVKRLEKNLKLQDQVNEINKKLESREDKKLNALWKQTKKFSVLAWNEIYKELNTKFNVHFFESQVEKRGKEITKELLKKKIAKTSDGATIIDFSDFGEKSLGILVFLRKDGTVLYAGKDLALAEKKFENFKIDKSIYVIGMAQNLYINQIFETLNLMKFKQANKNYYVLFGEVRFPWGKMSSRTGENVLYSDFKKELVEYTKNEIKKRHKLNQKETKKRALAIAIASMKYAMLKQDTNKTIIFDKKEALKFEGNTGPYLLYTYARARSILRKAKYKQKKITIKEINDSEKSLVSKLNSFPEVVEKSYQQLAPSLIANYAYQIAQSFNEFYHSHKVIGSENEAFRLALVDAFSQVLKNCLKLLAIQPLENM